MRNLVLLAGLFTLLHSDVFSQKKVLKQFFSDENDTTRRTRLIVVPALGYSQETGLEYGLVNMLSFYTDKDTMTRASGLTGLALFTAKKQSMFYLKPDVWSKNNRFHYIGDLRYRDFPINFYGIGSNTRKADEEKIDQKTSRAALEIEKMMRKGFYSGVNMSYENYRFSAQKGGGIFETSSFIRDKDGGDVLFLGFSQIIDLRNTNFYTTSGTYLKLNYSYAPDLFGGENFTGSLAKLDLRSFKSYNTQTVLAFNAVYQTIQGSQIPFYLLQPLGNDQVMRGYYSGRYRDRNLLATQLELKYRFIPRLSLVGFASAGTVYSTRIDFGNIKPSYGAGIRYFFDTIRGLSLRMDYALGEKRAGEERQKGFYVAFGEAF